MTTEKYKNLITSLEVAQDEVKREAQQDVDHYWQVMRFGNKDRELKDVAHHAPRVRTYPATGSVNIMWEHYPYRKDKTKRITNLVKPTKRGYTRHCFRRPKDWEWDLIQKTEKNLDPLRHQLKQLQDVKQQILRLIKIILKNHEGENHE